MCRGYDVLGMIQSVECQMSKTFIGGAVGQEFESEAPTAEEMLEGVTCSREVGNTVHLSDVALKYVR